MTSLGDIRSMRTLSMASLGALAISVPVLVMLVMEMMAAKRGEADPVDHAFNPTIKDSKRPIRLAGTAAVAAGCVMIAIAIGKSVMANGVNGILTGGSKRP